MRYYYSRYWLIRTRSYSVKEIQEMVQIILIRASRQTTSEALAIMREIGARTSLRAGYIRLLAASEGYRPV